MSDAVNKVGAYCLAAALMDEPWQDLGFRRRPKHGRFIQRFRPSWKVALEKRVLQQIIAVFTAVHVKRGRYQAIRH